MHNGQEPGEPGEDALLGFATRAIHAGESPDPFTGAAGIPIYQNATFAFRSAEQIEAFNAGTLPHYVYTRVGNPTVRCLELKLADLEGAESAVTAASGMAAISVTVLEAVKNGGHLVASNDIYFVAREFLRDDLPQYGAAVTFVNATSVEAIADAIRPDTRAIHVEVFGNPALNVVDLDAVAALAKARGVLLIVDNTFLSPALLRPVEHGADIVIHSATKYLSGHGTALGGVVAGRRELVRPIAARLSRLGGALSPFSAWLIMNGVKTLSLRVGQQCANAQAIAELLAAHPAVAQVNYPGLPTHPQHDLATHLTGGRAGGMISFTLKDHERAKAPFLNALRIPLKAVSLGDVASLIWPYGGADLIRFSAGIEETADVLADFRQALDALQSGSFAARGSG